MNGTTRAPTLLGERGRRRGGDVMAHAPARDDDHASTTSAASS